MTNATVVASKGGAALVDLDYSGDATSDGARRLVADARAYPAPAGVTIGVTGYTADLVDQLALAR